jgi:hypothetical protein
MGAHFWSHIVPYQDDIGAVLAGLREQEFRAGRFYQPSEIYPGFLGRLFGRKPYKPKPPKTIEEAIARTGSVATGTRSILDMERISETPDFGTLSPVSREELQRMFGTEQPTLEMIEKSDELIESIERGHGIYIIIYEQRRPERIYLAGYSYD